MRVLSLNLVSFVSVEVSVERLSHESSKFSVREEFDGSYMEPALMLRTLLKLGKGTNSRQCCTLWTHVTVNSSSGGKYIVKLLDDVISC